MKNILYAVTTAIAAMLPTYSHAQASLPDSVIKQLDASVAGFKERYHSPSIVVLVVHDQQVIYSKAIGYTDIENKAPASTNAKYPILSMTKPFTATMLMQLVQRKIVKLDDNVAQYLPEFQANVAPADKKVTTLFQLATHTSGLPRNPASDIGFTEQVDRWLLAGSKDSVIAPSNKAKFLDALKYQTYEYPKYQFLHYGDRHYSNLGYCMLGIALERAAKIDYAAYVVKNIFQPLGMSSSGFMTDDAEKNKLAKGYLYDEKQKTFIKTPWFQPNATLYAGGMYTTANNLAKFLSFQFNDHADVLSNDYKAMMTAFNIAWKPAYPFTTHEGAMLGYRSEIAFNPAAKVGWVILTNTTDFDFGRLNDQLGKLIMPVYAGQQNSPLQAYAGTYSLAGHAGSLEIYVKDGALYSSYLNGVIPNQPLQPAGRNQFQGAGRGSYHIGYEFLPDEKGEIKKLNMGQLMWSKE